MPKVMKQTVVPKKKPVGGGPLDRIEALDNDEPEHLRVLIYGQSGSGDGALLYWVMWYKIRHFKQIPMVALKSVYGVDIMPDNVIATRKRLLQFVRETKFTRQIVEHNIRVADALNTNLNKLFHPQRPAKSGFKELK